MLQANPRPVFFLPLPDALEELDPTQILPAFVLGLLEFPLDHQLGRDPRMIDPRLPKTIEPLHSLPADQDVFQCGGERVAQVQGAGHVGWRKNDAEWRFGGVRFGREVAALHPERIPAGLDFRWVISPRDFWSGHRNKGLTALFPVLDQPFQVLANDGFGYLRNHFPGDPLDHLSRSARQGSAQRGFAPICRRRLLGYLRGTAEHLGASSWAQCADLCVGCARGGKPRRSSDCALRTSKGRRRGRRDAPGYGRPPWSWRVLRPGGRASGRGPRRRHCWPTLSR